MSTLSTLAISCLSTALTAPFALASSIPQPVSPGATGAAATTDSRCPTFSWAGAAGASGYELAVYRIVDNPDGGTADGSHEPEPVLSMRVSLPGDARAWTPSSTRCLERGERYAWSIATTRTPGEELVWSEPLLLRVDAEPSLEEVEAALATLERFRASRAERAGSGLHASSLRADAEPAVAPERTAAALAEPRAAAARDSREVLPGSLTSDTTSGTSAARDVAAASSPTLAASASLSVAGQVHLAAASAFFKEDQLFLWDDGTAENNLALGRHALSSVVGTQAKDNTAVGSEALRYLQGGSGAQALRNTAVGSSAARMVTTGYSNTATGAFALAATTTGTRNTAVGASALEDNAGGNFNTAIGYNALPDNQAGYKNTALGAFALRVNTVGDSNTAAGYRTLRNTTGDHNIALGYKAGFENTTGSHNIFVGNEGYNTGTEETIGRTIRIGKQTSGDSTHHNRTFIAGISGTNVSGAAVLVSTSGQLGVNTSTRNHKQDIQDLEPFAERVLELRPVAFRYKEQAAIDDAAPLEFGLIAEEVAEVLPELVLYGEDGKPLTVKYHLLSSLLLGELQEQRRLVGEQRSELESLRSRLDALESSTSGKPRGRSSPDAARSR